MFAVTAVASEKKPAQYRHIVVPTDGCSTFRTVGTRANDGLPLGKPGDTDIQKTAEEEPHDEGGELKDAVRVHPMSIRFERPIPMRSLGAEVQT